jgi:hypothetical protein
MKGLDVDITRVGEKQIYDRKNKYMWRDAERRDMWQTEDPPFAPSEPDGAKLRGADDQRGRPHEDAAGRYADVQSLKPGGKKIKRMRSCFHIFFSLK